jgi:hypothetical protein
MWAPASGTSPWGLGAALRPALIWLRGVHPAKPTLAAFGVEDGAPRFGGILLGGILSGGIRFGECVERCGRRLQYHKGARTGIGKWGNSSIFVGGEAGFFERGENFAETSP